MRFRWVDSEAIVLRQSAGQVMVLNEVGGRIVELASGAVDLGGIVAALCEEFEGDQEEIASDALSFIDSMIAEGVLEMIVE